MVKQSDVAFRLMARKWGAHCCYTPMLKSLKFLQGIEEEMAEFVTVAGSADRPLIVQVCGRCPKQLADMALLVHSLAPGGFDAFDLNLGCPMENAEAEGYGSFLIEDAEGIQTACNCVQELAAAQALPVCCKIRILASVQETVRLARLLEAAGCSLLTVHGRRRAAKGRGPVDWGAISAVRAAVGIPVVANGGIRTREEADLMMQETGCAGVMVATALLINPRLFAEPCEKHTVGKAISVALEYLQFAEQHLPRPIVLRKHFWYFFRNVLLKDADDDGGLASVRGERMPPSLLGTEGHKFYTFMNQPFLCSVLQFRAILRLMAHKLNVEPWVKLMVESLAGEVPVLSMAEIRRLSGTSVVNFTNSTSCEEGDDWEPDCSLLWE
ncbi:Dus1l [Symbiodinium pilosum]|uniref:Dus1l protein n=1 Tax=Symbiodinium pilosum TaxID=2952 RepID=A0A812SCE1_SYMPI|nr:Dus1l [Symbiodinium pilosum]